MIETNAKTICHLPKPHLSFTQTSFDIWPNLICHLPKPHLPFGQTSFAI